MKTFVVTLILVVTHVAVTLPAWSADMSTPAARSGPSPGPRFIAKGTALTPQELAAVDQRSRTGGRISEDAGGKMSKEGTVLLVLVGLAALGTLIAIEVAQAEDTAKYW